MDFHCGTGLALSEKIKGICSRLKANLLVPMPIGIVLLHRLNVPGLN
jgi:hypothetical protein